MIDRDELVEIGARAVAARWANGFAEEYDREVTTVVIDAVEPIIRADEQANEVRLAAKQIRADVAEQIAQAIADEPRIAEHNQWAHSRTPAEAWNMALDQAEQVVRRFKGDNGA